ncbi:MAG: ATP-binding protein [Bacteroidota bacterium]
MTIRIQSIRARLTFWYTLLVLSTLLLFGTTSYYFTSRTLSENLDLSLKNEVRWVRDFIQPQAGKVKPGKRSIDTMIRKKAGQMPSGPADAEKDSTEEADEIWNQIFKHTLQSPKKTYIQFTDRRGTAIYRSYNLGTDSLVFTDTVGINATVLTTGWLNGEPIRIALNRDKDYTYLVGYPLAEVRELLQSLYVIFLILAPIALAVSAFGGLALANKSLSPVKEIATRARRITAENLDQTIPVKTPNDEIGQLTLTINDMIRRLRDSFAQVRQFSADVSHELRTPLTIVRGEIELALRSPKSPEEYRRVLESTLEEILRLTSIIDNLLTLAKADQGLYRAEFSEVNLKTLVEELYEDSEVLASRKGIRVTLNAGAPITIVGDRLRLRQLFLNLIDNAIKYTPGGGAVTMEVIRQDGTAVFRVSDTGIGIPAEDIPKVFDRFYRVDKARSREMGGTGLGLSIAKWIAELHRGSISVESEPQKGSVFTVKLPVN